MRHAHGARLADPEAREREESLAAVRAALGEEAFATAWAEGQAMGADEATEYGMRDDDERPGSTKA